MRFAERLRHTRLKHSLSLQAVGRQLGVSKQSVSYWEHGRCRPDDQHLDQLCVLFGWDFSSIHAELGGDQ